MLFKDFVEKANKVHNYKYVYKEEWFNDIDEKYRCLIECPIHGQFPMKIHNHLNGQGCPQCKIEKQKGAYTTYQDFVEKATKIHNNKYIYTDGEDYINMHSPIKIICPIHGEFQQPPSKHLSGCGCKKCGIEYVRALKLKTVDEVIDTCMKVHNGRYKYDKDTYIDTRKDFKIICPVHGEFWQTPSNHMRGHGCPKCNRSLLETDVARYLKDFSVIEQYNKNWLQGLSLDFYLPEYNVAIECQGGQHFEPCDHFGGVETFEKQRKRDRLKKELCENNGVKLLYFSNKEKYNDFLGENVLHNEEELINAIDTQIKWQKEEENPVQERKKGTSLKNKKTL